MNKGYRKSKNLLWLRDGDQGSSFSGNPAEITSLVEHYKEDGWDTKKWHDSLRVTREWNLGNVDNDFTMITKNSLDCMESNGAAFLYYTIDADQDDPLSQLGGGDMSFTMVFRWDGVSPDVLIDKYCLTPLTTARLTLRAEVGGKLQFRFYDGAFSLGVFTTSAMISGAWNVVTGTLKNQLNDGEINVVLNQDAIQTVTYGSWNPIGFTGATGTSRLYSNNSTTEKWDGACAEMVACNDIISPDDISALHTFLLDKWDI